jgi:hypothetical protein
MYYPLIGEQARVRGHRDKQAVISANYTSCAVEVNQRGHRTPIEKRVSFSVTPEGERERSDTFSARLAAVKQVLRCSQIHIYNRDVLMADLQESLSKTVNAIRVSQQLIDQSDVIIARARILGCK